MRYHYLDAVRAWLLSLGFIYHAIPILWSSNWFGYGQEPKNILTSLGMILHSFRMQGFYLIAGFFAMMLIKKYGNNKFLKNRLIRLGIPFFFVGFTFNSVMEIVRLSHKNINWFSHIFSIKYFIGGSFQNHLWFLPTLILFCCFLFLSNKFFPALIAKCTEYHFRFSQIYCLLMLLALGLAVFAKCFPKSPYGNWFVFNIDKFAYYFPFFILGVIFFLNKEIFENYINSIAGNICVLALAVVLLFIAKALPLTKYIRHFLQFPIALSINGILFILIKRFFNYNNKCSRSISDASYTMYLLHQPTLVMIAFFLVKTNLNFWCQLFLLVLTTWFITYFIHLKIVRRFPVVSFVFNGQLPKKIDN